MIELEDTTAPMNHSLDGLKRRDDTGKRRRQMGHGDEGRRNKRMRNEGI